MAAVVRRWRGGGDAVAGRHLGCGSEAWLTRPVGGNGTERPSADPRGYVLNVPADFLDATVFAHHAELGRRALADGDPLRATPALEKALALWRGDALADCRGGGWAETEAVRLDELRWSTVEDRIDAD